MSDYSMESDEDFVHAMNTKLQLELQSERNKLSKDPSTPTNSSNYSGKNSIATQQTLNGTMKEENQTVDSVLPKSN